MTNELRDALAALYANGVRAGMEAAADLTKAKPALNAADRILAHRAATAKGTTAFFRAEWPEPGEATEWQALADVLALLTPTEDAP